MRYMYTRTQLYKMVSMYVYIYTVYTFIHNSMFIVLNTVLIHIQTQFCCATVYMYLYRCWRISREQEMWVLLQFCSILQHPAASCSLRCSDLGTRPREKTRVALVDVQAAIAWDSHSHVLRPETTQTLGSTTTGGACQMPSKVQMMIILT